MTSQAEKAAEEYAQEVLTFIVKLGDNPNIITQNREAFLCGVMWTVEQAKENELDKHNSGPGGCILISDLEKLLEEEK